MSAPSTDEPRISLLYVDDEPALLEIARIFLERTGNYSVSTCDNANDALKIIPEESFDAIISDYQMPDCDGISFLKYLRKIGNKTPFIIFTGRGREDVVIQALNEGADFYIQKGGDPKSQFAELANKVRYAVTRKQAEEELKHEKALMDAILSSVPGMLYLYDSELKLIRWNANHSLMTGYSPEELSGMHLLDWYKGDEESQAVVLEGITRTMKEGFGEAEANLQKKDGTTIPMYFTACPVTIHGRQYFTGIGIDITEQKKQKEELENFFAVNLDLLCIADLEGNFIKTNEIWSTTLGYSTEELNKRKFLEFVHPDDLQATLDVMADLGRGEDILNFTNRYRSKEGSYRYIEWRSHPIGNRIYAAARDITDRKTTEEALRTANKKLHLLSSITRHDIQNKIMTLQGYLDLSQSEITDPKLSGYLNEIEKAATSIQKQIEFTRIYESLGVHRPTWQPLSPIIEAIDDSPIPICHDCGEYSVHADPMFERVLHNLYDNTIRYAEGADCVRIRCEEKEEGTLLIIWEDNGPGIPDDQKKRIFDKGVGKNTGLGLFLTREILSITGITISETGVYGEGARFEIRVPAGGFRVS